MIDYVDSMWAKHDETGISELPAHQMIAFSVVQNATMRSAIPFCTPRILRVIHKGFIGVQVGQLIKSARVPEPRSTKASRPGNSKSQAAPRSPVFAHLLPSCSSGDLNQSMAFKSCPSPSVSRSSHCLFSQSASVVCCWRILEPHLIGRSCAKAIEMQWTRWVPIWYFTIVLKLWVKYLSMFDRFCSRHDCLNLLGCYIHLLIKSS